MRFARHRPPIVPAMYGNPVAEAGVPDFCESCTAGFYRWDRLCRSALRPARLEKLLPVFLDPVVSHPDVKRQPACRAGTHDIMSAYRHAAMRQLRPLRGSFGDRAERGPDSKPTPNPARPRPDPFRWGAVGFRLFSRAFRVVFPKKNLRHSRSRKGSATWHGDDVGSLAPAGNLRASQQTPRLPSHASRSSTFSGALRSSA